MNTIKYRAFVEVARHQSLTAAAEVLGYTQPGISHMIRSLEDEYGFPLLYRSKNSVTLTESGKTLYDIYVRILNAESDLNAAVNEISGAIRGTLRIGAYTSVLLKWIPDIVAFFAEHYPKVDLQLFEGEMQDQITMLQANQIDVGICSAPVPKEYDFVPVLSDPLVVVLPLGHPLTKFRTITKQELLQYADHVLRQHRSADEDIRLIFGNQVQLFQNKYTVRHDPTLVSMVKKGLGISIMSSQLINTLDTAGIEIRAFEPAYERTLGLMIPPQKSALPVVKCFKQAVCKLFG